MRELNRNGLKKFLGKLVVYEATFTEVKDDGKILVKNLKQVGKSKILAEHAWLDLFRDRYSNLEKGAQVIIEARAQSYRDSFGIRKYKLVGIRKFVETSKYERDSEQKVITDNANARKRKGGKRWY